MLIQIPSNMLKKQFPKYIHNKLTLLLLNLCTENNIQIFLHLLKKRAQWNRKFPTSPTP